MLKHKYTFFPTHQITPDGWVKKQLEIQAAGLNGNLDKIWPDVSQSQWIGGSCEGWERVPYWLDGFVPLACLLKNPDLAARAKKFIDAIIARQQPDGWLCPCPAAERPEYDTWATLLICKVLTVYADCFDDRRIEEVVYRCLKQFHTHLQEHQLFNWGKFRWFEGLIPVAWLYERRPEPWLSDLAGTLKSQGFDYPEMFKYFTCQTKSAQWEYESHIVNLAMALKSEALYGMFAAAEPDFAEQMLNTLRKYHGNAYGFFNGDECLAGNLPTQGTELCAIVEAMYAYEWLLAITGKPFWGDLLERLAFNALPAAVSADMWSHQYDQQVNQISAVTEPNPVWTTNSPDANIFGLEPNFGCCTANFGQGWPKFAAGMFLQNEQGFLSAVPLPGQVNFKFKTGNVECRTLTDYPFSDTVTYVITTDSPILFDFAIRLNGHAEAVKINGQAARPGTVHVISQIWQGEQRITVEYEFLPHLAPRPRQQVCAERGNLLFCLPLAAKWQKQEYVRNNVERKFPYCDYEVSRTESGWNYAFLTPEVMLNQAANRKFTAFKQGEPPWCLTAKMQRIEWPLSTGTPSVPAMPPEQLHAVAKPELKNLIPYGFSTLRMTEMPIMQTVADELPAK